MKRHGIDYHEEKAKYNDEPEVDIWDDDNGVADWNMLNNARLASKSKQRIPTPKAYCTPDEFEMKDNVKRDQYYARTMPRAIPTDFMYVIK